MPRGYMLLPFQAPRKLVMAVHLDQSVHLFVGPEELQRLIHRHLRYPHRLIPLAAWKAFPGV